MSIDGTATDPSTTHPYPKPKNLIDECIRVEGLAQLQAMRDRGDEAPMAKTWGFELMTVERGRAVLESESDQRFYNPIGTMHGGYAATLLDSACGIAVHSRIAAKQGYTTLELKIACQRALTDRSGRVRVGRSVVSMG